MPCAGECRGCYGPLSSQCRHGCKNYKVFPHGGGPDSFSAEYNCTRTCPDDHPHKIFNDDGRDPYCSADPLLVQPLTSAGSSISAIIGGIVGCILLFGVFISVFGYQWRQRCA